MFETTASAPNSSKSNRAAAGRQTRWADRNGDLVDRAGPEGDDVLLPTLDEGITLLDVDGGRDVPALQSLVLDHLLLHDGPAFWVDADGHATTATLSQLAPSRRLLDRIRVARGFTAYQHFGAVCDLSTAVNRHIRRTAGANVGTGNRQLAEREADGTAERDAGTAPQDDRTALRDEGATPHPPSLVVAPAVDALYRADDALGEERAQTLQARALARLTAYAESYDVPVLLTRSARDEFAAPIEAAADHRIECERTRMGPRFVGEEFETLVYPVAGGAYRQTTFAYWRRVLGARAERLGVGTDSGRRESESATSMCPADGAAGVGTGVTADGESATLTANPLLDAWSAGVGGR